MSVSSQSIAKRLIVGPESPNIIAVSLTRVAPFRL
jgi:hypothetical protein